MNPIARFTSSELKNFDTLERITTGGYEKTGLKFSVHLNGSKGYLDNIEISCELSAPVRIPMTRWQDKEIWLFHDKEKGLFLKEDKKLVGEFKKII